MRKIRFADYLKDYLNYNNITNKDFANRIGISQKHLIEILSGESELSTNIIENISIVTNIPSDYIYRIELNYKLETEITNYLEKNKLTQTEYLNKFNYKYLITNSWIDFIDKTDKMEIIKDILKYLRVRTPEKVYEIDENIFFKSTNDKPELLLLWLEKCYRETLKQKVKKYNKDNIEYLVNFIKQEANKNNFNEQLLIEKFNENGIALVIKEDIPGSKIRGAFKVHKNAPAVYITYKHKRIADIYFALLHELAHCKSDFNKAKSTNLISFYDVEESRDKEAYNWMVEEKYYNEIKSNKTYDIEKENRYPKSFIVYRLAHDKIISYSSKKYQKYNTIISNQ